MEREPRWLRYNNQGSWNQYGWMLGEWRLEAAKSGRLGDVEPRLLKLVLAELRAELETREPRNKTIYHRNNPRYWAEKEDDFRRTAENVSRRKGWGPRSPTSPSISFTTSAATTAPSKCSRLLTGKTC